MCAADQVSALTASQPGQLAEGLLWPSMHKFTITVQNFSSKVIDSNDEQIIVIATVLVYQAKTSLTNWELPCANAPWGSMQGCSER